MLAAHDCPALVMHTRPNPTVAVAVIVTGSATVASSSSLTSLSSSFPSKVSNGVESELPRRAEGAGASAAAADLDDALYRARDKPPPLLRLRSSPSSRSPPSVSSARAASETLDGSRSPKSPMHIARKKRASAPPMNPRRDASVLAPTAPSSVVSSAALRVFCPRFAAPALEAMSMSENLGKSPWMTLARCAPVPPAASSSESGASPSGSRANPRECDRPPRLSVRFGRGFFPPLVPMTLYGFTTTSSGDAKLFLLEPFPAEPAGAPSASDPKLDLRSSAPPSLLWFLSSRRYRAARRNIPCRLSIVAGFAITSFMPAATHWPWSSGCDTAVNATRYALRFTGPPCARMCRATSYPSSTGNTTFVRITSNSMFAHAAAAWLAFSAKCVMHPNLSSDRVSAVRERWRSSRINTRFPSECFRNPGHRCALDPPSVVASSGVAAPSWFTSVNAAFDARSTAPRAALAGFESDAGSGPRSTLCLFATARALRPPSSPDCGNTQMSPASDMCTTSPPAAWTVLVAAASVEDSAAAKMAAARPSASFSAPWRMRCSSFVNPSNAHTTTAPSTSRVSQSAGAARRTAASAVQRSTPRGRSRRPSSASLVSSSRGTSGASAFATALASESAP